MLVDAMSSRDWNELLRAVSARAFAVADQREIEEFARRAPGRLETRWLGFPGAEEEAVVALERHLALRLPGDYRAFLRASDGFLGLAGFPFGLCSLSSSSDVGLFRDKDATTGRLERYRHEHGAVDPAELAPEWCVDVADLARTLLVGESDGNECILLLPAGPDNDWEVWTYDPEAGFGQAPSFLAFMEQGLG
jgi:hypothetical protein